PADALYDLLADATTAPLVFPGTVHVEHLARSDTDERLRIWAARDDDVRCWTSHRVLDRGGRRVTFRQEAPTAPIAAMQGRWSVEPLPLGRSRVRLDHAYRAVDDDPEGLASIEAMVDRVSNGQLAALQRFVGLGSLTGDGPASFHQSATSGCPVERAYDFVHDATGWADLAPVTGPVAVGRPRDDMQLVDLTLAGPDGPALPLQLARVAFPGSHIAFTAIDPAPPLAAYTGQWRFEAGGSGGSGGAGGSGSKVSVDHTLLVDPASGRHVDARRLVSGLAEAMLTSLTRSLA
ncbi:MAG TPA: SRPBCC family protein, partial [Acidimicrobiales bacterium]|nr:SRPBCC family protein [Acidimicrobiales bacterium]